MINLLFCGWGLFGEGGGVKSWVGLLICVCVLNAAHRGDFKQTEQDGGI